MTVIQTPVTHGSLAQPQRPSQQPGPSSRLALTVLWVMTYRCSKAPSKVRSLLTADPCWMFCVEYGWPSLPGPK